MFREYSELGNLCRNYESLSRTSLGIFVAFSTGIIAFALRPETVFEARVTLYLVGLVFALFTLNVLARVRLLYSTYVRRARRIEEELNMEVYLLWDDAMRRSFTIRNKLAMLLLLWGFIAYFFGRLIYELTCGS